METLKYYFRVLRSIFGSIIYGFPSRGMLLIGVTGTSGKSTTSAMIYHILQENDIKVGIISTVGAKIAVHSSRGADSSGGCEKVLDTGFHVTTPDPIQLQKFLRFMKNNGAECVVLETSSHALAQGRLGLLKFDFAVFTNIKSDHLDWHGTWENYAEAKFKLVEKLKSTGTLIINRNDEKSYDYIKSRLEVTDKKETGFALEEYSLGDSISEVDEELSGITFRFFDTKTHLNLLGTYNLSNFLAAAFVAGDLGISTYKISQAIQTFEGLEGRMQIMQRDPFTVIVDFAHNADSLEKSLDSIVKLKQPASKLIAVFGSAGLRDKQKRTDMGIVSGKLSDITIVTAEDPRTESLKDINSKIIEGAESSGAKLIQRFGSHDDYLEFLKDYGLESKQNDLSEDSENDDPALSGVSSHALAISSKAIFSFDYPEVQNRFDAIALAIKLAQPGDVVITEGKGHEKSLAFGTTEYPFTDQQAVEKAL